MDVHIMSRRTRIYETTKIGNKRMVTSQSLSDYILFGILKWICKAILFCLFFWIIIPLKLIRKHH